MHCYFQGKGCEIFPMDLMMAQEGSQLKKDLGFPGGSDGNESACKAGNRVSIPGSGRSLEEGMGVGDGQGRLVCYSPWGPRLSN